MKKSTCILSLLLFLVVTMGFLGVIKSTSRDRVTEFNKGWKIVFRGQEYNDVDLEKFCVKDGATKGELVLLQNYLPFTMSDGSAVVIPLTLTTISADVNGTAIYGYGSDEYASGRMVGSGVHIIRIPDGMQGRKISLVLRAGEDDAFSYLSGFMIDNTNWGFIDYLNIDIYPVALSMSLIMAGMVFMVISAFVAFKRQDWVRINQTGTLFFTIGCWNLCETNSIQLFSLNYNWNTFSRYFFGMLSILPVLRIINNSHFEKNDRDVVIQKFIFNLNQVFILIAVVLSFNGYIHICNATKFFQISATISIVIVAYVEWRGYSFRDMFASPRFREQLVCFIFILIESVRYMLHWYFNFRSSILRHSSLLYGTVVLVMMMIGSYIIDLYESYLRQAEEKSLKRIAYTDGLTGLLNRAFCKERMEELDKGEKDYHMISFDVDNLKTINDSKGHQEGDKLLISFADILTRCFSDVGDVIRPGGDEFLVISDDADRQELMGRLNWLYSLQKNAERNLGFPVTAAYGIAGRSEVPGKTTEEVYYLADLRMYEMKMAGKEMH